MNTRVVENIVLNSAINTTKIVCRYYECNYVNSEVVALKPYKPWCPVRAGGEFGLSGPR